MKIQTREADHGVLILDLQGNLTVVEGAEHLRERVKGLVEDGRSRLVLNLQRLDYIDSSGIGAIVACYTLAHRNHGALKLISSNSRFERLLSVVEMFEDEAQAVQSFAG